MRSELKLGLIGGRNGALVHHANSCGIDVILCEGDYRSYDEVIRFGEGKDLVVIQDENVCTKALKELQEKGVRIYPSPDAIDILQDRHIQTKFLQSHGIPTIPSVAVSGVSDLHNYITKLPAYAKRCKRSGNNVMLLCSAEDIPKAFDEPFLLEDIVSVEQEFSAIIFRNEAGLVECYSPAVVISNRNQTLYDLRLCPSGISNTHAIEACGIAMKAAEALELVGLLVIEMFLTKDGKLLVSKMRLDAGANLNAGFTCGYEQALSAALGLSSAAVDTTGMLTSGILEPGAARKDSQFQAVGTLLGLNDFWAKQYSKEPMPPKRIAARTIDKDDVERVLRKTVVLRHILQDTRELTPSAATY